MTLNKPLEFHICITDPQIKATQLLADQSKLPIAQIKQAMQKGCVWHERGKGYVVLKKR